MPSTKTKTSTRKHCKYCQQHTQRRDGVCVHCFNIKKAEARYLAKKQNNELLIPNFKNRELSHEID